MKKFANYYLPITIYERGFTLIELLIVVAIIGILTSFLMANFIGIRQRARDAQRKADLRQIQSALELYRADQGTYPLVLSNCPASSPVFLGNAPSCGSSYLQKIPTDPLNSAGYTYSSNGTTYNLIACLENLSDSQKDATNSDPPCGGKTNWSFTLQNP